MAEAKLTTKHTPTPTLQLLTCTLIGWKNSYSSLSCIFCSSQGCQQCTIESTNPLWTQVQLHASCFQIKHIAYACSAYPSAAHLHICVSRTAARCIDDPMSRRWPRSSCDPMGHGPQLRAKANSRSQVACNQMHTLIHGSINFLCDSLRSN